LERRCPRKFAFLPVNAVYLLTTGRLRQAARHATIF
jgi:hypothetical protein